MKDFKTCLAFGVLAVAVRVLPAQTTFATFPSRIVGQPSLQQTGVLTQIAPNLVEGRELFSPQAMAVDRSATPPILYVADTFNNRVLAWKNAAGFQKGDFADLVIGQRDMYSVSLQGPGTPLSTGLFRPSGVAVDGSGNLYVADSGNNRIVRYPKPFQQTSQLLPVDMVLGQPSLSARSANQGLAAPTERTLSLNNLIVGMTFDSSGNLWVSDAGNNRVLRYPASTLSGTAFGPAADLVLGQPDFATTTLPKDFTTTSKAVLDQPGGIAFSPSGLLFVVDSATDSNGTGGRVLVYSAPFSNGQSATRIMGVSPLTTLPKGGSLPPGTPISIQGQTLFSGPDAIFFVGDSPFVVDTGNSRIMQFDPVSNWPPETTYFSPLAQKAYGQSGWVPINSPSLLPNGGQPTSSESTLAFPSAATMLGTDLLVLDSGNNRVIAIPQFASVISQTAQFPFFAANRLLGQLDFKYNSVNLIDGREVSFSLGGGSVALDLASSTPHLYVADAQNNRILGFKDARTVQPNQTADLVIGQPDFKTAVRNYPGVVITGTDPCPPGSQTASTLCGPAGVAVDKNGDLWVADTGNGRVLRFPRPFDQQPNPLPAANMVIGQSSFSSKITDPSSQTMSAPYSVAFTAEGHLVVSDPALKRVLFFHRPSGGDFTQGQAATNVIGQPDFNSVQSVEAHPLSSPRGIAVDPSFDRLYVADTGSNRILVYRNLPTAEQDPAPSIILGGDKAATFNTPIGVTVDQVTGEVWVADTGNNRVVRFPNFDALLVDNQTSNFTLPIYAPVALTLDAYGNPVVAEGVNRIGFYYHAIGSGSGNCQTCSGNAANYFSRFAPGMLATIKPSTNGTFGTATATFSQVPIPTMLGDVQVLVAGTPAPVLYASPYQINFQVPSTIPAASNLVEFDVVKVSTGQILAAWLFRVESFSPGLFTADATGSGQLLAVNSDGSINNQQHPAKAGTYITLYGTGQGAVSGGPPDGTPPTGPVNSSTVPTVLIDPPLQGTVQYSGLAPTYVGLWQINVQVPQNAAPGQQLVVVLMNDVPSSQDPVTGKPIQSYIWVTQ